MDIYKFELKIKEQIVIQGMRLYLNNFKDVEVVIVNNNYNVTIKDEDSNVFDVSITLDKNSNILEANCSCGEELVCPHKAAAIFLVRDSLINDTNNKYFNVLINKKMNKLNKDEIIKIVKEITNDDYLIKAKLILKTFPKRSEDYLKIIKTIMIREGSNLGFIIDFNNFVYSSITDFEPVELVKFVLNYVMFITKFFKTRHGVFNHEEGLLTLNLERYIYLLKKKLVLIDEEISLTSFVNNLAKKYNREIVFYYKITLELFLSVIDFVSYRLLSENLKEMLKDHYFDEYGDGI